MFVRSSAAVLFGSISISAFNCKVLERWFRNESSTETPEKSVPKNKRGRKRKGEEASHYYRICRRPFAVTYGNFEGAKKGYISTENIFQEVP